MKKIVHNRLNSKNCLTTMRKTIALFVTVLFFLIGCSFPFQSTDGGEANITDISSNLGFLQVSRQGFMGGSVLYNPKKPSTGQLAKGVTLAIRLGYVDRNVINSEQSVFTDIPEKAQFGFLYVSDISENSISFHVQLYDSKGNSIDTKSYYLKLNGSVDINSDGHPDMEYKKPIRKRIGFESAIYLNFLSSQKTLNTAMFAVLPEQYSRGVYPNGIIGINPDGKFIVRKYEDNDNIRRSMTEGLQEGDFVLDSLTGKYQRVVYPIFSYSARNISDTELEDIEESDVKVSYLFNDSEFIHSYTPDGLFNALPDNIKVNFLDIDSSIERLNSVLCFDDLIPIVGSIQKTPIPDEIFHEVVAQIPFLSKDEKIQLNRVFLEETYPELCPQAITESVCFTEILPLASILFGYDTENTNIYDDLSSRAASSYEYEVEKAALEKEFKKYKEIFKQPLTIPGGIPIQGGKANINLNNSYFALGFRGSFSASWGSVYGKVEGVIYITTDTNIDTNITFDKNLFSLSKDINIPVFGFGPICLNLTANAKFNVPLNVTVPASTEFKMRAAVTGMYGAGFDVGLNYGITWKKKWFIWYPAPYVCFNGNSWTTNKTIYYTGTDTNNDVSLHGVNVNIYPNASAAIGANISKVIWGDITTGVGVKSYLDIKYSRPILTGTAGLDGKLYLNANAFIGLRNIPIINSIGKDWRWDLLNYNKPLLTWQVFKKNL